MTPSTFWSAVEQNRNHYGNGYVWLRKGVKHLKQGAVCEILDMWVMPSDRVRVILDDNGTFKNAGDLWYVYDDPHREEPYFFRSQEVLHVKTSHSFDGIMGLPVQEILKSTVEGGLESQTFMNKLYQSGLTAKAVLEYTGDLSEDLKAKLVKGFETFSSGSNNAGRIIPVPSGMRLVPLSIKLTDSQFFELKKYTALQIAGAFGIKPNQINDYEKSSYANSEMQQLSFYVDTALYVLKQYEEELNDKMLSEEEKDAGYFYTFNEKVILRTDSRTQLETLAKGVDSGIYTRNEARELLNLPAREGGDILTVNGNSIPVTMAGMQWGRGGEDND